MNKLIGHFYLILLLAKSSVVFAGDAQAYNLFENEWLNYLLFDLTFFISVWLLFYVCKRAMTHSKKAKPTTHKMSKPFSIYSQYHCEPSSKNSNTPLT